MDFLEFSHNLTIITANEKNKTKQNNLNKCCCLYE